MKVQFDSMPTDIFHVMIIRNDIPQQRTVFSLSLNIALFSTKEKSLHKFCIIMSASKAKIQAKLLEENKLYRIFFPQRLEAKKLKKIKFVSGLPIVKIKWECFVESPIEQTKIESSFIQMQLLHK